ncbi:MAG: hypothetical protein WCI46_10355, partial [Verrucomicrobiota bacterium]
MPISNPIPFRFFTLFLTAIHSLQIYAATGLTLFAASLTSLLHFNPRPWIPLWFSAALLVYNADRLRHDPADPLKLPLRTLSTRQLRPLAILTLVLSALTLFSIPICQFAWSTLTIVSLGSLFTLSYSLPIFGFRWKDLPLIKSLFTPLVLTLAFFAVTLLALWSFLFLLFNVL